MNTAKDMAVHLRQFRQTYIVGEGDEGSIIVVNGSDHPLDDLYIDEAKAYYDTLNTAGDYLSAQLKQGGNALTGATDLKFTQGADLAGASKTATVASAYNPVPAGVDLEMVVTTNEAAALGLIVVTITGHYVEAA